MVKLMYPFFHCARPMKLNARGECSMSILFIMHFLWIPCAVSQNTVDMASTQQQHGDAEIDPQKIFKMLQQFDVLLQNSETADRPENDHSPGQTEKQSTGSQDHNYPSPLPNQNSDNEPLDPEVPRIEQSKGIRERVNHRLKGGPLIEHTV